MNNQDRNEYQFFEQNPKEEIPSRNSQKGKKNYYKNIQRNNQLDEKSNISNMDNYMNSQNFRKNQNKKNFLSFQGKNSNEEFENPQNLKKMRKKRRDYEHNYVQNNTMENSSNIKEDFPHEQNQINNYQNMFPNKQYKKYQNNQNLNNFQFQKQNQNNNQFNNNYMSQINDQLKQNDNSNNNNHLIQNQNFNYQNPNTNNFYQNQNMNKTNIQKAQNMLVHNFPNQNIIYMNQIQNQISREKDSESTSIQTKDEKLNELKEEPNLKQNYSSMSMENNNDNMNKHLISLNQNINQFIPNEMFMNKNFTQQGNYGRIQNNIYNIPKMIEQNQIFNINNNNNQNNQNYPFNMNEDIKYNNKKVNKINKSLNETPNQTINMIPNINNSNFGMPNLNYQGGKTNNRFYKNNTNNMQINNKLSLSMQGTKNTNPNLNQNINLNFMMATPQSHNIQKQIPSNIINIQQQRNYYNSINNNNNNNHSNNINNNSNPNNNNPNNNNPNNINHNNNIINSNNNNMNKKHSNIPYRTVNSDKNVIGGMKNKNEVFISNTVKGNYQLFQNNFNLNNKINNNIQNQNLNQRIYQTKNDELINNHYINNNQKIHSDTQSNMNNQILNQKENISSLKVKIKFDKSKEEIFEIKVGDDPINITNSLKSFTHINEQLSSLIYQKIIDAIKINKYILDLKPQKFYLKQINTIRNTIIENGKHNNSINKGIEPYLIRNESFNHNNTQIEKYVSDMKPSFEDIKKSELLNITL